MSGLIRLNNSTQLRSILALAQRNARCISTSQKKSETATISHTEKVPTKASSTAKTEVNKAWVSWGYSFKDEAEGKTQNNKTKIKHLIVLTDRYV